LDRWARSVLLASLGLWGHKDRLDHKVRWGIRVCTANQVPLDLVDPSGLKERRVHRVSRAYRASRVCVARREIPENKVYRVWQAREVIKANRARLVPLVASVPQAQLDRRELKESAEKMVPLDHAATWVLRVSLVPPAQQGMWDRREQWEILVLRAPLDHEECKAPEEIRATSGLKASPAWMEAPAPLAPQVRTEPLDPRAHGAVMVLLAPKVRKARLVRRERLAIQALRELLVSREQQEQTVLKDPKVFRVCRARQAQQDHKDCKACRATRARSVLRGNKEQLATREFRAQLALLERLARQVKGDPVLPSPGPTQAWMPCYLTAATRHLRKGFGSSLVISY
jgi:hypothetical protein